jgi:trimethylamine---corrinoid protein Co-methyltransferase
MKTLQPRIELLSNDLIARILDEAFQLMQIPGIKVQSSEAREILINDGAIADGDVIKIPEKTVRKALDSTPNEFYLFDRIGNPKVHYGGEDVHFDPGSSGVHILDPINLEHTPSTGRDLLRIVKVVEMLPQYDAQSTAVVCNDVPKTIGDLYRLYIILLFSQKPIITGSFSLPTLGKMLDMLAIFTSTSQSGKIDRNMMAEKPQAVFDVCPSPPLIWSEFGAGNLIQLARANIPAELVSMPLAGVAAPVTLLGSIVQHSAESLSGIAIHQLANPGAPIVWGGAPAIFDMRHGTTPMGAIETAMIDVAYAQVGKSLNLPTHTYLGASDSKTVDAQAGMETGISAMIGALAGINMISGAGMLDFLACQSVEKLVLDAEAIGMTKRLLAGIEVRTESLATALYEGINFKGDFLKQKVTRELFAKEQYLPSAVIDRESLRGWQEAGSKDTFERARQHAIELLEKYEKPIIDPEREQVLKQMVANLAAEAGMDKLPELD